MALIDKASLLMVPSTYEAGKLYNVLPSGNRAPDNKGGAGYDQTRADFDFDRGSNAAATRINSSGLIEKYRENLALSSGDISTQSTFWNSNQGGTTTQNSAVAPDGTTTASTITSLGSQYGGVNQTITTSASRYTYSVYLKSVSGTPLVSLIFVDTNGLYRKDFTLTTSWQRYDFTTTLAAGSNSIYITSSQAVSWNAWGAQLELGLVATDVLTSGATTGKAGVLVDMPRINYDANGENGALLLESSRANLVPYSEYFGAWTMVDTTLTQNYGTSPEGFKNTTRLQFADSTAYIYISAAGTSSGTYASSIYIKGTDGETIKFGKGGNVASGAMHTLNGEWQRIEHITTDVNVTIHISTYGGSTARDIEIYGCQVEEGSYISSYIPNHSGTGGVTRAADSCSVTGASDVIGQTEGTMYAEINVSSIESVGNYAGFRVYDGTTANAIAFIIYPNGRIQATAFNGGSLVANINDVSYGLTSGIHKIAFAYKLNDYILYVDGLSVGTDTSASVPATSQFNLSHSIGGSHNYNQTILFKERLTNAELATLTTL